MADIMDHPLYMNKREGAEKREEVNEERRISTGG